MAYRVVAGSVTVETNVGPGRARIDIPRGELLPDDVPEAEREHLRLLGHVEAVQTGEAAEPDGPGVDEDGDGVPEGSAHQVLEWVAGDPGRAQQALDAELAKPEPRKGLTADLQKIIDA